MEFGHRFTRINAAKWIFSRTLAEVTEFPELVEPISELPGELIIDGEILAWRDTRPLPFTELQRRLGRKRLDLFVQNDIPVKYVAFDLLFQDGELLLNEPLTKRKAFLDAVCANARTALHAAGGRECRTAGQVQLAFHNSLQAAHEGIVATAAPQPYVPGRRGRASCRERV